MTTYELLVQLESSLDNEGPTKRSWDIIDELKECAREEHERMYARARPIGIGDMAVDLDTDDNISNEFYEKTHTNKNHDNV